MSKIPLWPEGAPGFNPAFEQEQPTLEPFLVAGGPARGAVLVCPGGGYNHLAAHEGEPIARWLNSIGLSAFVLRYRVAPYRHPIPWMDATRAMRTLRARAAEWNILPDKLAILGFSAGGHLSAWLSNEWDAGDPAAADPVERAGSRPDASVICYGVITFDGRYYHGGSVTSLLGDPPPADLRHALSLESRVTPQTSPAFLWHTATDDKVPVQNCLLYAHALSRNGVPVEVHIFPEGRHGLGLALDNPNIAAWKELCATWLRDRGW